VNQTYITMDIKPSTYLLFPSSLLIDWFITIK